MDIDHSSMRKSGRAIHDGGGEFGEAVNRTWQMLGPLVPYFGDPDSDEAARIFRRGQDGHPGFDAACDDLGTALRDLTESYRAIGDAVVAMSSNVKDAEWAGMMVKNEHLKALKEFAEREDRPLAVPSTPVERD
ncbi:hypothetical protein AB0K12_28355 [Nonomuraea sp. NPDC049419]|uniref:hypothetical protein n=1 Tax=Nonomuraea sp. NPDC049419 TaxID=3155772 RepID=UPI00341831C1